MTARPKSRPASEAALPSVADAEAAYWAACDAVLALWNEEGRSLETAQSAALRTLRDKSAAAYSVWIAARAAARR